MHSNFSGHISIIRFAALALLALCLVQPQVRAQEEVSFVFHTISWGMGHGETVSFTVFNPKEPVKIDNSTGRTTAVWLTVGFFEVVPAPKSQ